MLKLCLLLLALGAVDASLHGRYKRQYQQQNYQSTTPSYNQGYNNQASQGYNSQQNQAYQSQNQAYQYQQQPLNGQQQPYNQQSQFNQQYQPSNNQLMNQQYQYQQQPYNQMTGQQYQYQPATTQMMGQNTQLSCNQCEFGVAAYGASTSMDNVFVQQCSSVGASSQQCSQILNQMRSAVQSGTSPRQVCQQYQFC